MKAKIGVVGSGAMGSGIAQVAATAGHEVVIYDSNENALKGAQNKLRSIMDRLVEKGKVSAEDADGIFNRVNFSFQLNEFSDCGMVIEAIIEDLEVKKQVFKGLETICEPDCILATNTSSLSVAAISSVLERGERMMGIHFFNPAPLMPLVEIVPCISSDEKIVQQARELIDSWGKITVVAKDTPGFIVNRLARPFYGEAIRMYEEGMADFATIDWAVKTIGGFRMGPFELMDYIGNDINYTVTETVFKEFFYDPRYKPSFTQKRLFESGRLGRKSGRGYYDYSEGAAMPEPNKDEGLGQQIVDRILAMLINEAADALMLNIATKEDLDLAMTKGVNYPKGLLAWADEIGVNVVLDRLESLQMEYGEDRYRPSPMLRRMVRNQGKFFG